MQNLQRAAKLIVHLALPVAEFSRAVHVSSIS